MQTDSLCIVELDIKSSRSIFDNVFTECFENANYSTGLEYNFEVKNASLNKSGKKVYKVTFNDVSNIASLHIVAEDTSNSDMVFKPLELSNFNSTFYKLEGSVEPQFISTILQGFKELAKKTNGSFGTVFEGFPILVDKGHCLNDVSVALLNNKNNKVYALNNTIKIEDDDDDYTNSSYIPKFLINEWLELDENIMFKQKLDSTDKKDQFELMGQYAVYQKRKNMISADQFRDILIQVGSFADMFGGFKDESLNSIYQFFV